MLVPHRCCCCHIVSAVCCYCCVFCNCCCCVFVTGAALLLLWTYTAGAAAGVALTFEKLRIANVKHGKNCVSSPATKTTISTDLPKICPGHDRAGLQTAHRPFWLRHQQYVGTSIPSPGWDGEGRGRGKSKMFRPTASALQTFSAGCKKRKD